MCVQTAQLQLEHPPFRCRLPWLCCCPPLRAGPGLICLPLRVRVRERVQMRAALLTSAQCATYDELKNLFVRRLGWEDNLQTHFTGAMLWNEGMAGGKHACGWLSSRQFNTHVLLLYMSAQ